MDKKQNDHLCVTCRSEFPTCTGNPIFSIDKNPELRGKEADKVVECDRYFPRSLPKWETR